jgi:hypothetical protein
MTCEIDQALARMCEDSIIRPYKTKPLASFRLGGFKDMDAEPGVAGRGQGAAVFVLGLTDMANAKKLTFGRDRGRLVRY